MNRYNTLSALPLFTLLGLSLLPSIDVFAHGSMAVPESRVYNCRFNNNPDNPTDPACAAAKEVAGPQAFYNWNGINQGNANGNHQAVVPNGQLCAGLNTLRLVDGGGGGVQHAVTAGNSPLHYASGSGSNWQDAWTRL